VRVDEQGRPSRVFVCAFHDARADLVLIEQCIPPICRG
jgi:hypothetical protein